MQAAWKNFLTVNASSLTHSNLVLPELTFVIVRIETDIVAPMGVDY